MIMIDKECVIYITSLLYNFIITYFCTNEGKKAKERYN